MIFLMRVQSFNIVCSLVFHNLYIVHTMKYILIIFLNYLAWWRHRAFQMATIQRLLCITFMTSQSHLRRNCCIVMSRGPCLLGRCFKRGFGDHRKQPIYEFNWIVIWIEIRLSTLRPVANDLFNDALRLDNELSALAATCSLRSVSKVQINHLGLQNPL